MKIDKPKNLIKSKNLIFFAINTIAHLAIIPAILYGEWWMWILGILWGYLAVSYTHLTLPTNREV